MAVVLYGPNIFEAIAKGDLEEMRKLVDETEEHLRTHGNVPAALEVLKAEITKVERQGRAS